MNNSTCLIDSAKGFENKGLFYLDPTWTYKPSLQDYDQVSFLRLHGKSNARIPVGYLKEEVRAIACCTGLYVQVPKRADRTRFQAEAWAEVESWRMPRLKAVLGIINNLTFQAAKCAGAVIKNFTGQYKIVRDRLLKLIANPFSVTIALKHTTSFVKRFWGDCGASAAKNSVRGHIEKLKDLGLLDYDSYKVEKGDKYNTREYYNLDIPKLLTLAEMIETRIMDTLNRNDIASDESNPENFRELMPNHGGLMNKMLFEALFPGFGYRKIGDADTTENENCEPITPWLVTPAQAARIEIEKLHLRLDALECSGDDRLGHRADLLARIEQLEPLSEPICKPEPLPSEVEELLPF